jgi:hypothetical protein
MTIRDMSRARNAAPASEFYLHNSSTFAPVSRRVSWLRLRHPLSITRAELLATLAFGVEDER